VPRAPGNVKIKVLGSAAGGGFPQWNCNCRNCDGVRRGTLKATRRTESSIAALFGWGSIAKLARVA
jgi:phosphoribosyl 1,2-cyclic phosphodiesterase